MKPLKEMILDAIDAHKHLLTHIRVHVAQHGGPAADYRQFDRIMQELRKEGVIEYVKVKDGGLGWQRKKPC